MAEIPSFDRVSLHYEIRGEGEPSVVLVHGWGFDGRLWDAVVPRLARTRRTVTMDLPGHGLSGHERRQPTIASFAEDVRAVVAAAGGPHAVLAGHSMGGNVVVEAARLLPDRVVGVVLIDTLLDVDRDWPAEQRVALVAGLEADFPGAVDRWFRQAMFAPDTDPALVESVVGRAKAMDPQIGIAAVRSTLAHDPRDALRALRIAVRAVNADRYPTRADAMRRYVRDFDHAVVGGTGHYPMLEKPEPFAALLDEAVAQVARAGGR